MKKVLAFVAAFAVCGNVVAKESTTVEVTPAQVEVKASWSETITNYTTKPVEKFMQNHPWYGIAAVVVATIVAEQAAKYAYENLAVEQADEDNLDIA